MYTIWIEDKAVETVSNLEYADAAVKRYRVFYQCLAFVMPH
jgi:hypothetical protein